MNRSYRILKLGLLTGTLLLSCGGRAPAGDGSNGGGGTTNTPPTTVADTATVTGSVVTGNVLSNDTDANGDALTVVQFTINGTSYNAGNLVDISKVGSLVINADGAYTFTPSPYYRGVIPDVTYVVSDSKVTVTGTLSFINTTPNNAPTASNTSITVPRNIPFNGTLPVATDLNGDAITYAIDTSPSNGTVIINSDGTYIYTSTGIGPDSFTYKVTDSAGASSSTYTVAITVSEGFGVNSLNDSGPGSLREAIVAANAISFDATPTAIDIDFAFDKASTITLSSALPEITRPINFKGPSSADKRVTVSGNGIANNIFIIDNPTSVATTITNLTIIGSKYTNGYTGYGIWNKNRSILNVEDVITSGNDNKNIFNNGTATIKNSTMSDSAYGIHNDGTATIINSTISGNGNGIRNYGTATISNSTISGNDNYGINYSDTTTITNSTISGNRNGINTLINVDDHGIYSSDLILKSNIIYNNTNDIDILVNYTTSSLTNLDIADYKIKSLGYNLIGRVIVNGSYGHETEAIFNQVSDLKGVDANPGLEPLDNKQNPLIGQIDPALVWIYKLGSNSAAISRGNCKSVEGTLEIDTDQRGQSRKTSQCDIGAYETP